MSWGSTHKTNFKKIASSQKQAIRILVTLSEEQLKRWRSWKFWIFIKSTFTNLSYSCLALKTTPLYICFMKGLRTLTINTQLGLVKTILLDVKWNCHWQNLLYHLVDHISGIMYVCVSGGKKYCFFEKNCLHTMWMTTTSILGFYWSTESIWNINSLGAWR